MSIPKSNFINRSDISVKDFGAIGNNVADDTVAIQNAIADGYDIVYPIGNYKLGTTGVLGVAGATTHQFARGAVLYATVAKPITIHGQIDAEPDQHIFSIDAPGAILLPNITTIHPGWFGAIYDNSTDDGPAWRASSAAISGTARCVIWHKGGVSRINTSGTIPGCTISGGIVINSSNVTIEGPGSGIAKITINPASPGVDWPPCIFHNEASSAVGTEPTRMFNVGVKGIEFNFPGYGTFTGATQWAMVQFNRCTHVELDLLLTSDILGQNGTHTDGVGFAYECDDVHGTVRSFQTSKVACYLAGCTNVNVDVFASDGYWNSAGAYAVQVTNSQDFNIRLQTSGNGGATGGGGVIIVNAYFGQGAISTFTDQTHFVLALDVPRSISYASHLGVLNATTKSIEELKILSVTDTGDHQHFTIVLASAPNQTLSNGFAVNQYYIPNKRGRITGSITNTQTGVEIGENTVFGSMSEDITIDCDISFCTSEGIQACNYKNLDIRGHIHGCTVAGVNLFDVIYSPVVAQVAQNAKIDAMIGDNGVAGIFLQNGPKGVTIADTSVIYVSTGATQTNAILVAANSNGQRPSGINIGRFAHPGYTNVELVVNQNVGTGDFPTDGLYNLYDDQSPQGAQFAPLGSTYVNRTTGLIYEKLSAGTSNTGWSQLYSTNDSDTAATANKLVLRDSSGNLKAVQIQGTGFYNPAGGIFYEVHSGGGHLFGDDLSNSFFVASATTFTLGVGPLEWVPGVTPALAPSPQTTDVPVPLFTISDSTPWASATGTNRNNGGLTVVIAAPASGGTQNPFAVDVAGLQSFKVDKAVTLSPGGIALLTLGNNAPPLLAKTSLSATSGTTTLSGSQQQTMMIVYAATLTGNVTIDFGNNEGFWYLDISGVTLGIFSVSVKSGTDIVALPALSTTKDIFMIHTNGANNISIG